MSLQDLVANIDHLIFDVEVSLENQLGAQLLPFKGMDSQFLFFRLSSHFSREQEYNLFERTCQ